MSATENGFVTTSCTIAFSPEARSRWSAKPVISRIFNSGKSRAAVSASAMPSITGIWMSVSKRSNAPRSRVKISSASAPSSAVTVSWPSMAMARDTSWRMESSSSAIRTRGIGSETPQARVVGWWTDSNIRSPLQEALWRMLESGHQQTSYFSSGADLTFASRVRGLALSECQIRSTSSGLAGGEVTLVEEADVDIASFRRWRGKAGLEPGALARLEHALFQHRVPGIDLGALRVAHGEAQSRDADRLPGLAHDHALDDQHRLRIDRLIGDLDVLEGKPAQVYLEPNQPVEASGLRQQAHHVVAPDDQRQHQGCHGGGGGGETRAAQQRDRGEGRQGEQLAQARPLGRLVLFVMDVVAGGRRPIRFGLVQRGLRGPVGGNRGAIDD